MMFPAFVSLHMLFLKEYRMIFWRNSARFLKMLLLVTFLTHCGQLDIYRKNNQKTPQEKAKISFRMSLEYWEKRETDQFLRFYDEAAAALKEIETPSEKIEDQQIPETLISLIADDQKYRGYTGTRIRQMLSEAGRTLPLQKYQETGPKTSTGTLEKINQIEDKILEPTQVDKLWPLDREIIRQEITSMLEEWGEPAFAVDRELVRHVCYFYKYYSIKDAARTNETISRGRKYLPSVIDIFSQYRLPEEIAFALPFVESGFRHDIQSTAGAVGMFQFIKETARIYDLKVTRKVDERKDYVKAARACAQYLRNNRNVFASTVLSLGSYHHGTGKVSEVLLSAASAEERKFEPIFNNKRLGPYSREYIPQCLAAALIYRFLEKWQLAYIPEMGVESQIITSGRMQRVEDLKERVPELYTLNPDLVEVNSIYPYASTGGYILLSRVRIEDIRTVKRLTPEQKSKRATQKQTPTIKRSGYDWPKDPSIKPSGHSRVEGVPRFVRYIFQEGNDLGVLAGIFGTSVPRLKECPENSYLKSRSPRPGNVIRIEGLSPTAQKVGGGGYACGRKLDFRTLKDESIREVCARASEMVRTSCKSSQWEMGSDISPALIHYWNWDILGDVGPDDRLKSGMSLIVYTDYLWLKKKKSGSPTEQKPPLITQVAHAGTVPEMKRRLGGKILTYIVQDENIRRGDLIKSIAGIFHLDPKDLIAWNPKLPEYERNPESMLGKGVKLTIRDCPDSTQKFGKPGVVCGIGKDGSDTRLVMEPGETLLEVVLHAKSRIQGCGGRGEGITEENILYWNADSLKEAGILSADAEAKTRVRLTIYSDFY